MAIWRNLLSYFTGAGHRGAGLQSGLPSVYSAPPAVSVTIDTAMQLSAVWACARLIAETVGSMNICVYKVDKKTGTRTEYLEHPLSVIFKNKPNRWQTRQEYIETITYQLAVLGNAYSAIQRNAKGDIIALIPLMTEQMQIDLDDAGNKTYRYNNGKETRIYAEDSIWHVKLMGNGIIGLSPMGFARNAIGIGLAAEQSVAKIYRNGGKPSGILTIDKVLTPEQRAKIKENFSELAEGNSDRLFVLEAGMDFKPVSLSPIDIELLQSRRYQVEDIARCFGVPSVLINDTTSSTSWGSGISQIVQGWYKLGLQPYLERYESSILTWLVSPAERGEIEVEFNFNTLLRSDITERVKSYKEAVQGGIMTPNEARKLEGWEPKEGGDSLLVQQQMIQLERVGEVQTGVNNGFKE